MKELLVHCTQHTHTHTHTYSLHSLIYSSARKINTAAARIYTLHTKCEEPHSVILIWDKCVQCTAHCTVYMCVCVWYVRTWQAGITYVDSRLRSHSDSLSLYLLLLLYHSFRPHRIHRASPAHSFTIIYYYYCYGEQRMRIKL